MAPSKADKKKKDKKGDGGANEPENNNYNSANKNICCVPKGMSRVDPLLSLLALLWFSIILFRHHWLHQPGDRGLEHRDPGHLQQREVQPERLHARRVFHQVRGCLGQLHVQTGPGSDLERQTGEA